MKIAQLTHDPQKGWVRDRDYGSERCLVVAFADPVFGSRHRVWDELRSLAPKAVIVGCSTAGEILGSRAQEGSAVASIIEFDHTDVRQAWTEIADASDSYAAGQRIAFQLPHKGLKAIFLLSDGLGVNGSDLVRGLSSVLPTDTPISGGLSGDGARFQSTWILAGGAVTSRAIVAVGFYGERIRTSYGSAGGWSNFGVRRRVTRSEKATLFELDGRPALDIYEEYLGEMAAGLPATALHFPLAVQTTTENENYIVRTILNVDSEARALIFAGDIPQGSYARLMRASADNLVNGAEEAAAISVRSLSGATKDLEALAIAVSCVGRKLVLAERTEDELEAALLAFPQGTKQIGFYSYGELAPQSTGNSCQLHNQTMTITYLYEQ